MNVFLYSVLFLSVLQFNSENNSDTIKNNLSFELKPSRENFWRYVGNESLLERMVGITSVYSDPSNYVDGQQSWVITSRKNEFNTCIYAYFNLTEKAVKTKVSVYSKTAILNKAWLKLYCLDEDENILKKDSVSIINEGDWQQFSVEANSGKTEKVYIEIEAMSKDTILTNFRERQKLWIDKCEVQIDGHKLVYVPHSPETINKEVKDIIELDSASLKGMELIEEFKKHRIIALGESVHGSDDMQRCAFETIKYLVEHENCRLVLLELNFELGMLLNEYVVGELEDENIEKRMILYNYDYQRLIELLKWIKRFNKNNNEKVRICGIDENVPGTNLEGFDHLIDYLKNRNFRNDSLTVFYEYLKNRSYNKAMECIAEKNFLEELRDDEKSCVIRAIELRQKKYISNPSIPEGNREKIQFQNAKFAISLLIKKSSKTVIYAHLGHVNKLNTISGRVNFPNFGNYMYNHFKNDYFVAALLAGEGTLTSSKPGNDLTILPLQSPVNSSLEKQLMTAGSLFYYISTSKLEQAYFIRSIGFNYVREQFYPCSFKNRFDAVIFTRHSTGYSIPENWPKTIYEKNIYIDKQRKLNGLKPFFK